MLSYMWRKSDSTNGEGEAFHPQPQLQQLPQLDGSSSPSGSVVGDTTMTQEVPIGQPAPAPAPTETLPQPQPQPQPQPHPQPQPDPQLQPQQESQPIDPIQPQQPQPSPLVPKGRIAPKSSAAPIQIKTVLPLTIALGSPLTPQSFAGTPSSTPHGPVTTPLSAASSNVFRFLPRSTAEQPPPPPVNEPLAIRQARERRELKESIAHIHAETKTADGEGHVFLMPVDVARVPGYAQIIKHPMDLSTIGKKLLNDEYTELWQYLDDMHLMFENCMLFNKLGTFHHRYSQKILRFWAPRAEEMAMVTLASHGYCCGKRRVLSGVSYRCRGGTCFIKYGCVYWEYDPKDGDDVINYCQSHYQRLKNDITIPRYGNGTGREISFLKLDLSRAKHNTPLTPEKLIMCERCGHRDHEICTDHLIYSDSEYYCSRCKVVVNNPSPTFQSPRDLPKCTLSDVIEAELSRCVPLIGSKIVARVVDHESDVVEVKPFLKERFPDRVSEFPYVRKMILCFVDVGGRPVCFYGMIVHEYDSNCPEPNKERTYLALLDSVKLPKTMLPSAYRTEIYHAVIRGYLRSAGNRGFQHCHIYTCPPRKGQNYIFPFKPDDQKEISIVRLRKWYADIMTGAMNATPPAIKGFQNIGVVYAKPTLTEIPYFDGDNWPDMLEDILKLDKKQRDSDLEKQQMRQEVEAIQTHARDTTTTEGKQQPQCVKPRSLSGYFEGTAPPKKKRKIEPKRPTKPRLTADARLQLVMAASKRDFLVVKLGPDGSVTTTNPAKNGAMIDQSDKSGEQVDKTESNEPQRWTTIGRDPDVDIVLARIHGDQTVSSFMKAEKLEFSSLRHVKFSTMILLYALFLDTPPPERFARENNHLLVGDGDVGGGGGGGVHVPSSLQQRAKTDAKTTEYSKATITKATTTKTKSPTTNSKSSPTTNSKSLSPTPTTTTTTATNSKADSNSNAKSKSPTAKSMISLSPPTKTAARSVTTSTSSSSSSTTLPTTTTPTTTTTTIAATTTTASSKLSSHVANPAVGDMDVDGGVDVDVDMDDVDDDDVPATKAVTITNTLPTKESVIAPTLCASEPMATATKTIISTSKVATAPSATTTTPITTSTG